MNTHIHIAGIIMILLAIMHVGFPRYFKWKREQQGLSLINKQIMQTHTVFIALTVLGIGYLSITHAELLTHTDLGKELSMLFGIFWLLRFLFQQFFYSPKLWKGKGFETCTHILFSLLTFYMSAVYFSIVW